MNRTVPATTRRGGQALLVLPLLLLLAVFLPLPVLFVPVLLFIALVMHSRAAPPPQARAVLVSHADAPGLRSPPF